MPKKEKAVLHIQPDVMSWIKDATTNEAQGYTKDIVSLAELDNRKAEQRWEEWRAAYHSALHHSEGEVVTTNIYLWLRFFTSSEFPAILDQIPQDLCVTHTVQSPPQTPPQPHA